MEAGMPVIPMLILAWILSLSQSQKRSIQSGSPVRVMMIWFSFLGEKQALRNSLDW